MCAHGWLCTLPLPAPAESPYHVATAGENGPVSATIEQENIDNVKIVSMVNR